LHTEQGEALTSAGLDGVPAEQGMTRTDGAAGGRALDEFTEPVSYDYAFFHFVFACASTYIAMLLTGWGAGWEEKALMDIGWASVTMKLITQWATGLLYLWTLIAPVVMENRVFTAW
jgi:serine incorporator 1/3